MIKNPTKKTTTTKRIQRQVTASTLHHPHFPTTCEEAQQGAVYIQVVESKDSTRQRRPEGRWVIQYLGESLEHYLQLGRHYWHKHGRARYQPGRKKPQSQQTASPSSACPHTSPTPDQALRCAGTIENVCWGSGVVFTFSLSLRHSLVNTLMHILALSLCPQVSKKKKTWVTFSYFDTDVNIKSSSAKY